MNEKMEIIQRLVRDGSIDLAEALVLLEKEQVETTGPAGPLPTYPLPSWPQQWPSVPDPIVQPYITWQTSNSNEVS